MCYFIFYLGVKAPLNEARSDGTKLDGILMESTVKAAWRFLGGFQALQLLQFQSPFLH